MSTEPDSPAELPPDRDDRDGRDGREVVGGPTAPGSPAAAAAAAAAAVARPEDRPSDNAIPRAIQPTLVPISLGLDEPHELLPIGTELAGRFEIERVVGVGGMGVVYLARDRTLERPVAIKLHQASWGGARLQREAIAMARLAHPNVITVYEVGSVGTHNFVAMEFIDGKTLRAWATARPRTIRERLRVLLDAGAGLAAAHAAGLIHRDFKPDNILIGDDDGRARVGDFGLARGAEGLGMDAGADTGPMPPLPPPTTEAITAGRRRVPTEEPATALAPTTPRAPRPPDPIIDVAASTAEMSVAPPPEPSWRTPSSSGPLLAPLTQTGTVLGTPAYMAPEQAKGGAIDARADQFAFSVVAWELLFGTRPFPGTTLVEIIGAVLAGRRTPTPRRTRVPAAIRLVLERGFRAEPSERYADMSELLVELERAEHARRRRLSIAASAVAIAAGAVATVFLLTRTGPPPIDCERNADDLVALIPTRLPDQLRAVGAAETGDRVATALAQFRTELRTTSLQICHAAADHTLSPVIAQRGETCLQITARIGALLATLDTVTAADAPKLVVQVQGLGDVASCADPGALLAAPAPPTDPLRLAQFEAARAAVGAINSRLTSGNVVASRALLAEAEASPVAGEPSIAARILLARATIAAASDRQAEAERDYEDAYYAGRTIDDVDIVLSAVTHLIIDADEIQQDPRKADRWIRAGIADAERARSRSPHHAAAVFVAAAAATARGEHADQAAAWCATGIALVGPATRIGRIDALSVAGEIACFRGHNDECFADHSEAIAEARALLGPHHLRTAYLLQNAALDYADAGHTTEALELARQAEGVLRATPEVSNLDSLTTLDTLAGLLMTSGKPEDRADALHTLEDVRTQMIAILGPEDPQLAVVESNLSLAYSDAGQTERAVALLRHALALDEASGGPTDTTTGDVLYNLADAERVLGHFDAATVAAKRTVAIRAATSPGSALHGAAVAMLAHIDYDAGKPREALADARAALALPALAAPIEHRARAELTLARALVALHGDRAEATAAITDARAIFVAGQRADAVASCDEVLATLGKPDKH